MILNCDENDIALIQRSGKGLKCAQILLDENSVTAALVSIDHMGTETSREHVHILNYKRVGTGARRNQMPSMDQLEQALNTCIDESRLLGWNYSLLVLRLPFSVSHLIDVDQQIEQASGSLLSRIHNPVIELARQALRRQIQGPFVATDLGDRDFTTDSGLRIHDPRQFPAERLHFTGKLVVSEREYCNHVRDLLANRGIHANLIVSGPISLRGFLDAQDRHTDRTAVLYLDRHAVHAAIFDEGGLRHVAHYAEGTDVVANTARHHCHDLRFAHHDAWSQKEQQFAENLEPDAALSFAALDQACEQYAPGVVSWFQEFAARSDQADQRSLNTVIVASEDLPVAPCVARHAVRQAPNYAWDVISLPRSAIDFAVRPHVALRERALAQEVAALLEGADPLDFEPAHSTLTKARSQLVLGLNGLQRWTSSELPEWLRTGARRIGTSLYTSSRLARSVLRNGLSAART